MTSKLCVQLHIIKFCEYWETIVVIHYTASILWLKDLQQTSAEKNVIYPRHLHPLASWLSWAVNKLNEQLFWVLVKYEANK